MEANTSNQKAVAAAMRLIENAAQRGIDLKAELVTPVVEFQAAVASGGPTTDGAVKFWHAYPEIARLVLPVTGPSLDAAMSGTRERGFGRFKRTVPVPSGADRAVRRYRRMALAALFSLSVMQIYWLVGSTAVLDLEKLPKAIDDNTEAIRKRRLELAAPTAGVERPVGGAAQTGGGRAGGGPSTVAAEDSQIGKLDAQIEADETKIDLSYQVLASWNRIWLGPVDWIPRVRDQAIEWLTSSHAAAPAGDGTSGGRIEPAAASIAPAPRARQVDHREATIALRHVNVAGVQQQHVLTETRARFALQAMQLYLLPFIYGFLGTCVFILRNLSAETQAQAFSSDLGYRLRLPLGALAGVAIAWFINPENVAAFKSVPPLALAFLAGYSVEVLFSAMDRLIGAFSSDGGAAAHA